MASTNPLSVRREWEDWAGIGLGIAILLSPWIARQESDPGVVATTVGIGILIVLLSEIGLVGLIRSIEVCELACGLALIAWPFVMDYAGAGELRYWHYALGSLVALLAVLEIWQDRPHDNTQMAAHADS